MNNFLNRFFLKLILLPSALYRKMGVHMPHLKAILITKLMMDDRRPNSIQQSNRTKKDAPVRSATLGTFFLSALMGCIFLVAFSIGSDYLTKLTIYFAFYIFMLTSTLVADFTSVLIDVRDNMIILPKPVNDKTFVLARLLHIIIHVSKLVLPMTIPGDDPYLYNTGDRRFTAVYFHDTGFYPLHYFPDQCTVYFYFENHYA